MDLPSEQVWVLAVLPLRLPSAPRAVDPAPRAMGKGLRRTARAAVEAAGGGAPAPSPIRSRTRLPQTRREPRTVVRIVPGAAAEGVVVVARVPTRVSLPPMPLRPRRAKSALRARLPRRSPRKGQRRSPARPVPARLSQGMVARTLIGPLAGVQRRIQSAAARRAPRERTPRAMPNPARSSVVAPAADLRVRMTETMLTGRHPGQRSLP